MMGDQIVGLKWPEMTQDNLILIRITGWPKGFVKMVQKMLSPNIALKNLSATYLDTL